MLTVKARIYVFKKPLFLIFCTEKVLAKMNIQVFSQFIKRGLAWFEKVYIEIKSLIVSVFPSYFLSLRSCTALSKSNRSCFLIDMIDVGCNLLGVSSGNGSFFD